MSTSTMADTKGLRVEEVPGELGAVKPIKDPVAETEVVITRPNDQFVRNNLLYIAVLNKSLVVARELLNATPHPNVNDAVNGDGKTVIFYAEANRDKEMASLLIEHGASLSLVDSHGDTVLFSSVKNDREEMARFFITLKDKPNFNILDKKGDSPIVVAGMRGKTEIVQLLCNAGADPNFKDGLGRTAADALAIKGFPKSLSIIRKNGGTFSKEPKEMLSEAIKRHDWETAEFLISNLNIEVNTTNENGETLLIEAIDSATPTVLTSTVSIPTVPAATITTPTVSTPTVPTVAVPVKLIRFILSKGSNIGRVANNKHSAMTLSVAKNLPAIVKLLIEAGADKNDTYNGKPVSQIARENGFREIQEMLIPTEAPKPTKKSWFPSPKSNVEKKEG